MSVSMSNFLPPSSGDSVTSLLQVLGDPKEAKKALEKMAEERQAIDQATEKQLEQYTRLEAEARKTKAENEKLKAEADEKETKAATQLGVAKSLLAGAEKRKEETEQAEKRTVVMRAALDAREEKLEARERDVEVKLKEVKVHEDELSDYARQLTVREAVLITKQKAFDEDIAENNKWLESLKPPRRR